MQGVGAGARNKETPFRVPSVSLLVRYLMIRRLTLTVDFSAQFAKHAVPTTVSVSAQETKMGGPLGGQGGVMAWIPKWRDHIVSTEVKT